MRLDFSERFWRSYHLAPTEIRRSFDRRSLLLKENIRHPSLRAKKYDAMNDIRQARVNNDWRFYFIIKQDTYILVDITAHPK